MALNLKAYNASDLGDMVVSGFKFSQQCKDAAGKANRIMGFINRNFFKKKDIVKPMYVSLVRPHLGCSVQFWSPHLEKDIAKLEVLQRRPIKMITSLLNNSRFLSLEKRRLYVK